MKICIICLSVVFPHYKVSFYTKPMNGFSEIAKGCICKNCNQAYYHSQFVVTAPMTELEAHREHYVLTNAVPNVKEPAE